MTDPHNTSSQYPLEEVIRAAEARRDRHRAVLEWDTDWRTRGPDDPFTAAQEWGHHWHWTDASLHATRVRIEGIPRLALLDEDAQNDAWASEDAALTYEEARGRYDTSMAAYMAYLRALRPEQRDERIFEWFSGTLVDHFDQHFMFMVDGALKHESAGWERLTALLDARPSEVLHTGADGHAWTAAGVYAHLGRWMTVNIPRVEAFLAGGSVPDLPASVDDLNARWLEEDADLTFNAARAGAHQVRERFVAQMRTIPAERWTARLMGLHGGNAWGHYAEHLAYFGQ